ncbi:serine/threonine-protein kinase sty17 [Plakobranchus ocellatus]|uniref:Serine/threonine-protein kinase sty17 n=1 Tax=Plakobranchus ocellatus TaxID=259542 RepID=A0AAV4B4H7_9GAST|nr:serine/threonine-protein kinase sty17 [Plakobranchus ocellatus]
MKAMMTVVITVLAVLGAVLLIAIACYCKRTRKRPQLYAKLPMTIPSVTSSMLPMMNRLNSSHVMNGHSHSFVSTANGKDGSLYGLGADLRDYERSVGRSKKKIPVLTDPNILAEEVDMGQRLGGSFFMDTHLATYKEMTVSVKRLTLSIHSNQLTLDTMEMMKEEVWILSRHRHKNIVCILGLCLNGRLPFLLTEFVVGNCLKDFLYHHKHRLTWPQRVLTCLQIVEGMSFLHSMKPPIIHRDLRCGNIFLSDNDNTVKVADFGLTKLLQPLREQCDDDECGCQRRMSACPPSIRWTAPELLARPTSHEGDSTSISTACDVYSFSMVMLEMLTMRDPFDEVGTEAEVIELVKSSGRPEIPANIDVIPQYLDLMKICWDQRPSLRPAFKQVATKLKEMESIARSYHKQLNNKYRHSRHLHSSTDLV